MDTKHGTDFLVDRHDLSRYRWSEPADVNAPAPGCIRVAIERFAFTANNITYARTGEQFGYWRYFPAPEPWGLIPVWGIGRVAMSRAAGIEEGERVYGFWPTSREIALEPAEISRTRFLDDGGHRRELPRTYNEYVRIDHDPDYDEASADQHLVLRPLFSLGFFLAGHLGEIGRNLDQVVVSSASSKTALALAFLLRREMPDVEIVGLTQPGRVAAVEDLGCYDRVLPYEAIETLDERSAAFVDIAGNADLLAAVHSRLGANLRHSIGVGFTRGSGPVPTELPGAAPVFFFTPTHILRQRDRLGAAVLRQRIAQAWSAFLAEISRRLTIETHGGEGALERVYAEVLEGRVPPDRAAIVSLARHTPVAS